MHPCGTLSLGAAAISSLWPQERWNGNLQREDYYKVAGQEFIGLRGSVMQTGLCVSVFLVLVNVTAPWCTYDAIDGKFGVQGPLQVIWGGGVAGRRWERELPGRFGSRLFPRKLSRPSACASRAGYG